MITKVVIQDRTNTPIHYVADIPALHDGAEFNFKSGINIIVGPNGSGKSTLLKLIEKYLLIDKDEQNVKYLRELDKYAYLLEKHPEIHDGVDVYADYKLATFRFCHMNEMMLESDRAMSCVENFRSLYTTMSSSTGQGVVVSLKRLFERMFSPKTNVTFPIKELKNRCYRDDKLALAYKEYVKQHLVEVTDQDVEFTVLMDEPDRNLDILNIDQIYPILKDRKERTQIIAVIHNPLLIYKLRKNAKDINWVEMEEGYLEEIEKAIEEIIK